MSAFITIAIPESHLSPNPVGASWSEELSKALAGLPTGESSFWGIPFTLPEDAAPARRMWIGPGAFGETELAVGTTATHILVAHFFIPTPHLRDSLNHGGPLSGRILRPGEHLADYVLHFEDGLTHRQMIRRRFEVNDVLVRWGEQAFAARTHQESRPLSWRGPHSDGRWGMNQQGAAGPTSSPPIPYRREFDFAGHYWIYSLPNPRPEVPVRGIRLEPRGTGLVAIAGVTLFQGHADPLRHQRLETLRVDIQQGSSGDTSVQVDLGMVARHQQLPKFNGDTWLDDPTPGTGSPTESSAEAELQQFVELSASAAATLEIAGERVSFAEVLAQGRAVGDGGRVRVERVASQSRWISVSVVDEGTGARIPVRVHIRSADGRYLPPHGHRRETNDSWFEDYGGDLLLGSTPYAYVDGRFDVELPVGDVFVEIAKGFEYMPLRARVPIDSDQRELSLSLPRTFDWRRRGWVSADTHVHFLSPQTAWLEAQAEGINIVNLLAAQWGDLFTNVADYTGAASGVSSEDTIVWVGTENRQHLLGHMSLLGTSSLVTPLSAGGPSESYLGDPVWLSLSEWADRCRAQEGLVIIPHFPDPYCEVVADVVMGKVDGVEIRDFAWGVDSYAVRQYYRLLNCGYRVAVVGGTDKMSAGMPIGGVRTYAQIGDRQLSFPAWAEAVRQGRTFTSSGPLLDLTVEGRPIGESISLAQGGGRLAVEASAVSIYPLTELEIVYNGRVVAREEGNGNLLHLAADIVAHETGWIAARCSGPTILWHVWPVRTAAHTSPVYLVGKGIGPDAKDDRAYLSTILLGGLVWLDTLAVRADAQRHSRVRGLFLEALRRLEVPG